MNEENVVYAYNAMKKKKKILSFTATWMVIILSDINQEQKVEHCIFSLIHGIS